jgi:hypothetical protein
MGQISPFNRVKQLKKVIYGLSLLSSVFCPATLGTLSLERNEYNKYYCIYFEKLVNMVQNFTQDGFKMGQNRMLKNLLTFCEFDQKSQKRLAKNSTFLVIFCIFYEKLVNWKHFTQERFKMGQNRMLKSIKNCKKALKTHIFGNTDSLFSSPISMILCMGCCRRQTG